MMAGIEHAPTALGDIQGAIARPADETFEGRVVAFFLDQFLFRFVRFRNRRELRTLSLSRDGEMIIRKIVF